MSRVVDTMRRLYLEQRLRDIGLEISRLKNLEVRCRKERADLEDSHEQVSEELARIIVEGKGFVKGARVAFRTVWDETFCGEVIYGAANRTDPGNPYIGIKYDPGGTEPTSTTVKTLSEVRLLNAGD
jgi:hypothetical protein